MLKAASSIYEQIKTRIKNLEKNCSVISDGFFRHHVFSGINYISKLNKEKIHDLDYLLSELEMLETDVAWHLHEINKKLFIEKILK